MLSVRAHRARLLALHWTAGTSCQSAVATVPLRTAMVRPPDTRGLKDGEQCLSLTHNGNRAIGEGDRRERRLESEHAGNLVHYFFSSNGLAILKIRRNRLILHVRLLRRLEEKRFHFNGGWLTLNQRVQGSSPCAPTIEITALFARSRLEHLDHFDEFVPVPASAFLFAYAVSNLGIAARASSSGRPGSTARRAGCAR